MPTCLRCNREIDKGTKSCPYCLPSIGFQMRPVAICAFIALFTFLYLVYIGYVLPDQRSKRAIERVITKEGGAIKDFAAKAQKQGTVILGWETDLAYPICLVTYVYNDTPSTPDRKAFWWAVDLSKPIDQSVSRLKSIDDFVDNHLLPRLVE